MCATCSGLDEGEMGDVLRARKRSSERIAMAFMRSTETVGWSGCKMGWIVWSGGYHRGGHRGRTRPWLHTHLKRESVGVVEQGRGCGIQELVVLPVALRQLQGFVFMSGRVT